MRFPSLVLFLLGLPLLSMPLPAQTPPAPPPDPLHPDLAAAPLALWEKLYSSFEFQVLAENGHVLPYRLYRPAVLEPGKHYPLVLLLHGAGERGGDNRLQLRNFVGTAFWEKHPCFILAPQCPKVPAGGPNADGVWVDTPFGGASGTMKAQPAWPLALAMRLLDRTIAQNPVDPKRIYVTGLSMGGFATWELLQREGEKFAAAVPVCGGGDPAFAEKLAKIPLWVFHGEADDTVPVNRSRDMVAALLAAGGHPRYTEYPGLRHDAWLATYPNPEVWDWLFAQARP